MSSLWPHIRTFFILLHLTAITLMCFPAPNGGMRRSSWKDPTVQAEFAAWRERLDGLGWHTTPEDFEDRLFVMAQSMVQSRTKVLLPFKPYYEYAGTLQSWRMFVAPHTHPTRLEVHVREGSDWRPIFIESDPDHVWKHRVFQQERMRSVMFRIGWRHYHKVYKSLVNWVAIEASADFPEADTVRVRLGRSETPSPEEMRQGLDPKVRYEKVQTRELQKIKQPKKRGTNPWVP